MEADPNPFPEIKLFHPMEVLKKVGRFFLHIQHEGISDHVRTTETQLTLQFPFGSEGDYREIDE